MFSANRPVSDNKYKVYYFIQLQQQHIAICPLWFEKIYGRTNGQVPYSGNCAPAGSQIAKLPNSSRILALRSQCDDPGESEAPLSGAGDLSEHIHTHTIVYKYKLINFLSN